MGRNLLDDCPSGVGTYPDLTLDDNNNIVWNSEVSVRIDNEHIW